MDHPFWRVNYSGAQSEGASLKISLRATANAIADMNLGEINKLFDVAKVSEILGTEPVSRVLCRASG